MKLREYLDKNDISINRFASACGFTKHTIFGLLNGFDVKLSTAIKIEEVTCGAVKCIDLKPTTKRKNRKS